MSSPASLPLEIYQSVKASCRRWPGGCAKESVDAPALLQLNLVESGTFGLLHAAAANGRLKLVRSC